MNYLQACQDLVSELGLAGGTGPTTVAGQRGELKNVTRWIRESFLWIDNLWGDWKYHWFQYSGSINAGSQQPTPASVPVHHWDRASLWLDSGAAQAKKLNYMAWEEYRALYFHTATSPSAPTTFTVLPDSSLITYPPSDVLHTLRGEAWRRPLVLVNDNDQPLLPVQYHRLAIARAAIMYGNREDAPEIIGGFEAEYKDLLEKLQGDQAPSFESTRVSSPDLLIEGAIPGAGH